jgi:urea transport system permease protein
MSASRSNWISRYLCVAPLAAALLLPWLTDNPYWLTVIATAMAFSILAVSLDLLWGYSGILNLAPAMSFGLGAYTWGIVAAGAEGSWSTYVAVFCAIALPALVAALVAFVSFSVGTRDIYFALITLSLTLVLQQSAQSAAWLTGGSNGLLGIAWPTLGVPGFIEKTFDDPKAFYLLVTIVTIAVVVFCKWLVDGRIGAILTAIRDNRQRMDTLGYSTLHYRVLVSAIAAGLGGLAGMLYAPVTGIVDPSLFGVSLSIQPFVWVAVGGQRTLFGPLLAALLISIGQQTLTGAFASFYLLSIGAIFVVVVICLPAGLASLGPLVLKAADRCRKQLRAHSTVEHDHRSRKWRSR